jgi:chemotaxis protein methyltransferase CheR
MTSGEFSYIRDLLHDQSGLVLEEGKEYLAESRLQPLAQLEGFRSIAEMIASLRARSRDGLKRQVIEAMTTNETSFFRDYPAFKSLASHVIPDLVQKRGDQKRLSIWSAACSSGQEPYSIAMLLRDRFPQIAGWSNSILASDLSEAMLVRARAARYSQIEINRGLPAALLVSHFAKRGMEWEIGPQLRSEVEFRRINLSEPWPALPQMDLILMRNVLIYLSAQTKAAILARIRGVLRKDGYLFLGGTETTYGIDDAFERVVLGGSAFYRLRDDERRSVHAGC